MIQSDFPTRQPAPKIGENGTWLEWDELTQAYVDTGKPSRGEAGPQGSKGDKGDPGDANLALGIDEDDGLLYLYINGQKQGEGVEVGGTVTTKYSVTYTLDPHMISSNTATKVAENSPYHAVISSDHVDYQVQNISVTMGGQNITATAVDGNNIDIASVTGNIAITVTALFFASVEVENPVLRVKSGATGTVGVRLHAQPTQEQTVSVMGDGVSLSPATLTFTQSNWNVYQYVSVTADDVEEDTTAEVVLRNSDPLMTDTSVTVLVSALAYEDLVDMTIPAGAYTATASDFNDLAVRQTGLSIGAYTGANSNGATNVYIPPQLEYNGGTYKTIIKSETFSSLPDEVEYLHIDKDCVYTQYGVFAAQTTDLGGFGVKGANLVGVKYRVPTATKGDFNFSNSPKLKWVDGLQETVGLTSVNFKGCTALEYIPDLSNHTNIQTFNQAFWGCSSLKKLFGMPQGLTDTKSAFYDCTSLVTAEIPEDVTNVFYTFSGCSALKKVVIYAENITTYDAVFKGCSGLKVYVVKDSTTHTNLNSAYGSSASVEILFIGGGSLPVVSCWGDSTTSAGTDGAAWPTRLQEKIGSTMQVKNMAISGEYSTSIACRQGGNQASVVSAFTIPADTTGVSVSLQGADGKLFSATNVLSTGSNYNPVTISDIEGTVTFANGSAKFARNYAGESVSVTALTPVISRNSVSRKGDAVQVFYVGTNAGWDTNPQTLLALVQSMVTYYGGSNYIVMGQATGQFVRNETARTATLQYESLAAEAFGNHWLNLREYLIANSLTENELTATERDTERMEVGLVPWSILLGSNTANGTDDTHYNRYGLQSVCNAVYAKGVALGYWNAST